MKCLPQAQKHQYASKLYVILRKTSHGSLHGLGFCLRLDFILAVPAEKGEAFSEQGPHIPVLSIAWSRNTFKYVNLLLCKQKGFKSQL